MTTNIVNLGQARYPRRFHGQCQRCDRVDYLPWATEHGIRYCGHCWENDAIAYVFGGTVDDTTVMNGEG